MIPSNYSRSKAGCYTIDVKGKMLSIAEYPYLILDKQKYFQTTFGPSESEWVNDVERTCRPVFEVREDFDDLFFEHFAFEHSVDYGATVNFLEQLRFPEAAMLRIYQLADCLQKQ